MIKGYRDKRTKAFSQGKFVKQFESFKIQAAKRLRILEAATNLQDLAYYVLNGQMITMDLQMLK